MFRCRAFRARPALMKKGWAQKAMAGRVIAALIQWNRSRVASAAPDQTETDSSITFIEANPATARRISNSRPRRSVAVAAMVPASSSCASYPTPSTTCTRSAASTSASAFTWARFRVRFTRASRTPGAAFSARSTVSIQAAQWMPGSDSARVAPSSSRARRAMSSAAGAAEQAGQAEMPPGCSSM